MPEALHRGQQRRALVRGAGSDNSTKAALPAPAVPRSLERTRCRRLQSTDLMGPDTEIEIQHGEALYRLRLTSLGKLILTK